MENNLREIAKWIRYHILTSTTAAGSGHPTSSLSATDLMSVLFFGGYFRFFVDDPTNANNDRLIFSKGHASPLFYSLWSAAGGVDSNDLQNMRKFGSDLEGHPMPGFKYTEAATGSLGQGLSVGVGMALNAKYLDKLPYMTYVLLGDSEMFEGQVWEAAALAAYYKLDNLIAIIDVNRLGQANETIHGWNLKAYDEKLKSFGWNTIVIDGHDLNQIALSYNKAQVNKGKPFAIIAKTVKGKGVSFLENKEGRHGTPLSDEELRNGLKELGKVDFKIKSSLKTPTKIIQNSIPRLGKIQSRHGTKFKINKKPLATRKAYGMVLTNLGYRYQNIISLDAEVKNSTFAETFQKVHPERFFEMFIGEQNMVGVALGLSKRDKVPFVSTFAAFFTRGFDQIRMAQYSDANIKFVGSHAGVSIGEDGPSQMGLEDLALFSSLLDSVVLYPADAVSTEKLVEEATKYQGIVYIRTTRAATPIIYKPGDNFKIGGSRVIKQNSNDKVTIVTAGITLFEALKAYEELKKKNIYIRVIDAYSIKPIDKKTLIKAAKETKAIITVEDHYPHGGLGSAVVQALSEEKKKKPVYILSVNKRPKSGKPEELLAFEEIDSAAIVKKVLEIV